MSHLLHVSTDVCFPGFRKERRPGSEVLLKLGVRVFFAAVAAAGGASPRLFEGGSFVGAVGVVFHDDNEYKP